MGKRRIIGAFALGVFLFGGAFIVSNWTNIKRLQTVNSLFDADKIVHNFSHMDEAFLHHELAASPIPFSWAEDIQPLPEQVSIAGEDRELTKVLTDLDITGLVIIKDGKLIHESYYKGTTREDRRISWSMAKSFMSGLYGAALESGAVKSLDDKVESYVPSLNGSAYEGATIRNVLNMASGITFDENYMDPKSDINDMGKILALGGSMDDYAAGLTKRDVAAGSRWQYVSIDTHIAAMVLRAATGKTLHQLFNETYSAHLGFDKAPYYLTDGKNVAFALGGLNLTTRDYAKFGQLFEQGGKLGGKQIIPADWVAASTVHSAPTMSERDTGYGYQWWIPMPQEGPNKGDYTAAGIYGQYVYVNPAKNIVIAKNAADREFAYPQDGYTHSMNVNMDLFRSLADYYVPEKKISELENYLNKKGFSNKDGFLSIITNSSFENLSQGDFGEVFGLARACSDGNCESHSGELQKIVAKIKEQRRLGKADSLLTDDDLNAIWQEMLKEVKAHQTSQD